MIHTNNFLEAIRLLIAKAMANPQTQISMVENMKTGDFMIGFEIEVALQYSINMMDGFRIKISANLEDLKAWRDEYTEMIKDTH